MNSKVITRPTLYFQKEFKRLLKKYPSLKEDMAALRDILKTNPQTGIPLGKNTYKIRLAVKSKGKGKSGGARVISYVETEIIGVVQNNVVTLLDIYDKSEHDSISQDEIEWLIRNMQFE